MTPFKQRSTKSKCVQGQVDIVRVPEPVATRLGKDQYGPTSNWRNSKQVLHALPSTVLWN